jgi:hypothetical protein
MVRDVRGRALTDNRHAIALAARYARLLLAKASYNKIDFRVIEVRNAEGSLVSSVPISRTSTPSVDAAIPI